MRVCGQLGLDVGHERLGADGISSWMFAVDAEDNPYAADPVARTRRALAWKHLVMPVRDLASAAGSVMRDSEHAPPSYAFRREHILRHTGLDLDRLATPLEAWQQVACVAGALGWAAAAFRRHALLRGAGAVTELRLAADLVLVAHRADGALVAGHVRSSTYVGASLTSIVWRPDGAWRSRAILIVPDMLPADDFRRLRVMLRYARSAVEQGAPASHA